MYNDIHTGAEKSSDISAVFYLATYYTQGLPLWSNKQNYVLTICQNMLANRFIPHANSRRYSENSCFRVPNFVQWKQHGSVQLTRFIQTIKKLPRYEQAGKCGPQRWGHWSLADNNRTVPTFFVRYRWSFWSSSARLLATNKRIMLQTGAK